MAQLDSTICIQVNEISNLTLTFYWYMYCLFWFSGYGNPTASNVMLLWASQSYSYSYESDHCSSSSCDDYKQVRDVRCLDRGCWAVNTLHIHIFITFIFLLCCFFLKLFNRKFVHSKRP